MYRNNTHHYEVGLSSLFLTDSQKNGTSVNLESGEHPIDNRWRACVQDTDILNLRGITSGFSRTNPTQLLGSTEMQYWIPPPQEMLDIDIILFDTPLCLTVSDSTLLTTAADASIVLVVEAGRTRRGHALHAKERFTTIGWDITGIVLNGINPKGEDCYGYYSYSGAKN